MRSGFQFWISLGTGLGILFFANGSLAESVSIAIPENSEAPETDILHVDQTKKALGKNAGYSLEISPNADDNGVLTELLAKLFGEDRSIIEAAAKSTNLLEGETELTLAGLKIWNDKSEFKDGAYSYKAGIPTTQSRLKVFAFPVGPVTVQVDAGLAYEVDLEAKLSPQIVIPIQYASVNATLATNANIAGFVEGYAQFLFVRGGVGGQIDLLNGRAAVDASLGLQNRRIDYSGYLETLRGKIYGFADLFNLFRGRWKRVFSPTITDWKGFCFQLNKNNPDPAAPCGLE